MTYFVAVLCPFLRRFPGSVIKWDPHLRQYRHAPPRLGVILSTWRRHFVWFHQPRKAMVALWRFFLHFSTAIGLFLWNIWSFPADQPYEAPGMNISDFSIFNSPKLLQIDSRSWQTTRNTTQQHCKSLLIIKQWTLCVLYASLLYKPLQIFESSQCFVALIISLGGLC